MAMKASSSSYDRAPVGQLGAGKCRSIIFNMAFVLLFFCNLSWLTEIVNQMAQEANFESPYRHAHPTFRLMNTKRVCPIYEGGKSTLKILEGPYYYY